jgi:hypothetical protein
MIFNPDGKDMIPKDQDPITHLILKGALDVAGVDSLNGELLYTITPKMKEIMPKIYEDHISQVNKQLLNLWEKGYLNIDFFSEDPLVTVSKKGLDKQALSELTTEENWSLEEVKRLLKN